jgi:putative addiction module component (TIGR02574 family)
LRGPISSVVWWQMDVRVLEAEALRLEPRVRAQLAERLFESLAGSSYPDIDRAWVEEALARDDELDAGETEAIPADEVIRKARTRLG